MNREALQIVFKTCSGCPFLTSVTQPVSGSTEHKCSLCPLNPPIIVAKPPKWCPLRKQDVLVVLDHGQFEGPEEKS